MASKREAQQRHAQHYLKVLRAANDLYLRGGENILGALSQFDQNWEQIQRGQEWAVAYLGKDEIMTELCSAYAGAGTFLLDLRQASFERIPWLEKGLEAARSLNHPDAVSNHLGNLGTAHLQQGQYEQAHDYYQQSLVISHAMGYRHQDTVALGSLGTVYLKLGRYEQTLEHYQKALALVRDLGDKQGEADQLGNLGNAYSEFGQYATAVEYYQQVLSLHRRSGRTRDIAASLGNLGIVYTELEQYELAKQHCEQALAMVRELGDKQGEADQLGRLGNILLGLGQHEQAIDYCQKALTIAVELGDRQGEGIRLGNLGNVYYRLGQYEQALNYYEQSLAIAQEIGYRRGEGVQLGQLGSIYLDRGQPEQAIDYYQQALTIAREVGHTLAEGNHLTNLGITLTKLGEYEQAISFYQQARAIYGSLNASALITRTDERIAEAEYNHLCVMAKAAFQQRQYSRAIDFYQRALADSQKIADKSKITLILNEIGISYSRLGQPQRALDYHQQALLISRQMDNRRGEGVALGNIGNVYDDLEQYEQALDYYQQVLAVSRETDDPQGEQADLNNLSNVCMKLQQYEQAISYCQQALTIARQLEDPYTEGGSLLNLGNAYGFLQQYPQAISNFQQARAIFEALGLRDLVMQVDHNIRVSQRMSRQASGPARLVTPYPPPEPTRKPTDSLDNVPDWLELNYPPSANPINPTKQSEAATSQHRELDDLLSDVQWSEITVPELRDEQAPHDFFRDKAIVALLQGQYEKAIGYCQQALAYEIGDLVEKETLLVQLAGAFLILGRSEVATDLYQRALAIARQRLYPQGDMFYPIFDPNDLKVTAVDEMLLKALFDETVKAQRDEIGDIRVKELVAVRLAWGGLLLEDYEAATDHYQHALTFAGQRSDTQQEGFYLMIMADVYLKQGDSDAAIECYEEAKEVYEELEMAEMLKGLKRKIAAARGK